MSDLKKYLVLLVVVLAMALVGRFAWELLLSSIPTFPAWIWWTLFGITMSMICPLKIALFGRRSGLSCRRRHSSVCS